MKHHFCRLLLCSVPEQSHRIPLQEQQMQQGDELSSFDEHGQTVGDMNKSHNIILIDNIFLDFFRPEKTRKSEFRKWQRKKKHHMGRSTAPEQS